MSTSNVAEIARALRDSDFPPHLSNDESRLFIQVLRLVAEGRPVSPVQIEDAASSIQMPLETAIALLSKVSEKDDDGNIVGTFGLSQRAHPHRFELKDRVLSTWCAWDALFLPALLGQTADVETSCPATNENIRVRITPEHVENVVPSGSVISIVIPKVAGTDLQTAQDIRMSFCRLVHFFASKDAASAWALERHADDVRILSLEEGYQLGREAFAQLLAYT